MKQDFDKEYYAMNTDGADNHPLLAFCKNSAVFSYYRPIEDAVLPIETKFSKIVSYPKNPEFADALDLVGNIAISNKVYERLNSLKLYGLQMLPMEITPPKGNKVMGYHIIHIWNVFQAIDKENYVGDEPNPRGRISAIESFSLDSKVMQDLPLEKRMIFKLFESTDIMLVHQTVYDVIQSVNPTGFFFQKVSEWNVGSDFE